MAVLKRKSRMISFRLSEDEYVNLKNLCIHQGSRSVSDLARDAVNRLAAPPLNGNGSQFEGVVRSLQIRIDAMDRELKQLSCAVQARLSATGSEER